MCTIAYKKGCFNMKPSYQLGTLLRVLKDTAQEQRVGYVIGVKHSQRHDKSTNKNEPIFVYMLSGQDESWFYEDCLIGANPNEYI